MAREVIVVEKHTGERAYELWSARLQKALAWRQEHWNGDKAWKRALRIVRGEHWSNRAISTVEDLYSDMARDRITVNITGSTVEDFLPFLVRRHPEFIIRPKRPEFVQNARNQQNLLNYLWREKGFTKQLRRAVKDAVIIGHGVIKTGYRFELDDAALKPGVRINYNDAIREEEPWARRISPFHFLFDPDAPDHDLQSARWCAEILFRPIQDIVEDRRYKQSIRKDIRMGVASPTTRQAFMSNHASNFGGKRDLLREEENAQNLGVIWEVWDKRFSRRLVFIDGIEQPVIEEDWPYPYLDGFPYVMVPFIDLPDEHYPLGMVAFIEDQQMELNRIRTKEFREHRRTGTILTAAQNFVEESELAKASSGDALEIILHDGTPGDVPISAISMPTEVFKSGELQRIIMDDIRRMTGSDALVQGGDLKSRTSATEINARSQFFGLKLEDKVEKIDNFFADVARQILQHTQANMKRDKLILPLGINAGNATAEDFSRMTAEDIRGEFDLELTTVSAERVDRTVERQQRLQVMQIILQQLQLLSSSGAQIDVAELLRWTLETFDVKDIERFFPEGLTIRGPISEQSGQPVGLGANAPNPQQEQIQREASPGTNAALGAILGGLSGGRNT